VLRKAGKGPLLVFVLLPIAIWPSALLSGALSGCTWGLISSSPVTKSTEREGVRTDTEPYGDSKGVTASEEDICVVDREDERYVNDGE